MNQRLGLWALLGLVGSIPEARAGAEVYSPRSDDDHRRAISAREKLEPPAATPRASKPGAPPPEIRVEHENSGLVRVADQAGVVRRVFGVPRLIHGVRVLPGGVIEVKGYDGVLTTLSPDGRVSETRPASAPAARVAEFERVLDISAGQLAVGGDKVAAEDDDYGLWIVRARSAPQRLFSPNSEDVLRVLSGSPQVSFGFDRQGAIWVHNSSSGLWRWNQKWVLASRVAPKPPSSTLEAFPSPIPEPEAGAIYYRLFDGRGRAWAAGDSGAWVFDQSTWWRVIDAPRDIRGAAAQGRDTVWLATNHGLYRARLTPTAPVPSSDPLLSPPPPLPPVAPVREPARLPSSVLELVPRRVTFPLGRGQLERADSVALAPDGSLWFADSGSLVVVREGRATLLSHDVLGLSAHGLAPIGMDRGWIARRRQLESLQGGTHVEPVERLPGVSAVAVVGDVGWATACREDDGSPFATTRRGARWEWAPQVPHACYRSITIAPDGSAWLVGGLRGYFEDPVGEGILVHVARGQADWVRNPSTPLLCVAVTAAGDVWAGGYDGRLLHLRGKSQEEYRIDDEPWILGAHAHRGSVYLVGEALVGRVEGKQLQRISPEKLPPGTWQDAVVDRQENLWVVGRAGILKLSLLDPAKPP